VFDHLFRPTTKSSINHYQSCNLQNLALMENLSSKVLNGFQIKLPIIFYQMKKHWPDQSL
jgi:hypothetical protein